MGQRLRDRVSPIHQGLRNHTADQQPMKRERKDQRHETYVGVPEKFHSLAELIQTKDKSKKIATASVEFLKTFNGRSAKTEEMLALNLSINGHITSGSRTEFKALVIGSFRAITKKSRDKEIAEWLLDPQNLGSIIE